MSDKGKEIPNQKGVNLVGDPNKEGQGAKLNVSMARLETDSLRKYCEHFKIEGINFDSSREQMLNAVEQHFASQPPLNEQQVIPKFIYVARILKNAQGALNI
ncbi:Histone deacetylase complex subunit SAP30 [Theobroma cacao]|nr:Histone deacetylase complex subunit SAP30 [Theobroma cacao]